MQWVDYTGQQPTVSFIWSCEPCPTARVLCICWPALVANPAADEAQAAQCPRICKPLLQCYGMHIPAETLHPLAATCLS